MGGLLCLGKQDLREDAYGEYYQGQLPNENNKNNNCKYYKRKWYKFGKPKTNGIADGKLSMADNV